MKLKRILVFIILTSLLTCTACSKKTEKKDTKSQPTEFIDENTTVGIQEDNTDITNGGSTSNGEDITGEGSSSEGKDTISNDPTSGEKKSEKQESMEAYGGFLKNETKVYFDQFMHYGFKAEAIFESEKGYTLSEVLDIITTCYYENSTNTKINFVDYSYIDCGKDGVNELALRFNGMNIYSPEDDSTLVYIIKNIDGKLTLCYYYQTWARSESSMNEYGYYESYGSGGATNHGSSCGVVDKEGKWQFIVSNEEELDINQLFWSEKLSKIATVAETMGLTQGIALNTITFDDYATMAYLDEVDKIETFYTFYIYDEEIGAIEVADLYTNSVYKDIFDEAGVPFVTPDEVDAMIGEKEDKVGATEEIIAGNVIVWKALNGDLFDEYVGR